ncbi:MAG TPA: ATP-binding protein [Candidatus Limnocylindrales bacterium]|nr:ATP-binding protein [Candidatus Limnocylindrales bacterium]
MKTILVLSPHPDFAAAVSAGLNPEQYRVVHRHSADEGEPLLVHGLAAACILDADLMGVESVWIIERIRRRDTKTPIIAYTEQVQSEWEEEAFLRGVTHVLTKPVRQRLLNSVLDRLWNPPAARPAAVIPPGNTAIFARTAADPNAAGKFLSNSQTLDVLRDFSAILTHSLDAEAMLKQFLQFLREILCVNRAAIFLNRPCSPLTEAMSPEDARRLRSASAIGISAGLLEHFELSLDSGIGAQINRLGRILRRDSAEALYDGEVQKEFELLGAQVAVPIHSRDAIVGVAVFDGRVTGEPLVNVELELIFHLLEQVGLALRNIWLHDQLVGNHELMTDVLRELSSACVVVGRDLKVLHANKAARRHFGRKNERTGGLEFSDLPQALGAKIYQVLKTGAALEPFRYEPENSPGTIYSVSVVPFQSGSSTVPNSALLTADDLTQAEQLNQLKVEASNLRLVRTMADRLAHEIGNAMVPLSTHQQLLAEKIDDREFRESLNHALGDGVKRVTRLINQMRFLAREGHIESGSFPVEKLVEDAYQEAMRQQPVEGAQLKIEPGGRTFNVTGDRPALKHALAEIMLNALQANPKAPHIGVSFQSTGSTGDRAVTIEVQDNGSGFTAEAAKKVPSAFFTTRNIGLGLGLTVSQKIIETHHGKLEIVPSPSGIVRVSLPMEPTISTAA